MKKLFKFMIASILSCLAFIGIASTFEFVKAKAAGIDDVENKLIFHYDGDSSTFEHMWIWPKSGNGAWFEWEGTDKKGFAYTCFPYQNYSTVKEFGFLVVKGNWGGKDIDEDRYVNIDELTKDAKGNYHAYLVQGDSEVYTKPGVVQPKFYSLKINKDRTSGNYVLYCKTNVECKALTLYKGTTSILTSATLDTDPNVISVEGPELSYNLGTDFPDLTQPFKMSMTFDVEQEDSSVSEVTIDAVANVSALYKEEEFANNYTYDGELGAIYTPTATTFRVWTPISSSVKLRIYDNGTPVAVSSEKGDDTYTEYDMVMGSKGQFETTVAGDLEGKYYTYVVTNPSYKNREIVDPYAKSCGVNGKRGMIVDFSKTNPEGWDAVKIHEIPASSLTVWETHIADLTSSSTWGGPEDLAKTYKGFYQSGTTYTAKGVTVKTGFDHVKELGVNAVQIIPTFDSDNDEINTEFNWGYNPLNYNALDGSYSTNPYDGYERIKEFKELVKAYNEAGINIIMDVVYNHVMSASGSNFDVLMPGYYYRYTDDGSLTNGSGCGNETASEMPMMRKFMIDSTEFWASEYKLGGFRFDLMGLHDLETMKQLSANLHTKISEYVTVYGEPWTGGASPLDSSKAATQANLLRYEGYGQFNDQMRDALIKGGMKGVDEKGWITETSKVDGSDMKTVINGLLGRTSAGIKDPTKSVQYVTCHDNYTLHDRIKAIDLKAGLMQSNEGIIAKKAMLAQSVVLTSQGITFILAGEEFLRSKGQNNNSYNASYQVNELNYSLKIDHLDMFENYQKLISLKQNTNVFGKNADDIETDVVTSTNFDGSIIMIRIHDKVENKEYLIVHHNGVHKRDGAYGLNLKGYSLYLSTLGTEETEVTSGEYEVQKYETLVLVKDFDQEAFEKEIVPTVVEKTTTPEEPTTTPEEPATTPEENSGLSAGAIVAIVVASVVVACAAIYLVVGFTLYKSGVLTGKFFEAIYGWIKK